MWLTLGATGEHSWRQGRGGGGTHKIKVNHIYENGTLKVIRFKQAACVSGVPGFLSILNSSSV